MVKQAGLDDWLGLVGASTAFTALAKLTSSAAVLVVDAEDRVVFLSERAANMLEVHSNQADGLTSSEAFRSVAVATDDETVDRVGETEVSGTLRTRDGRSLELTRRTRRFFDDGGGLLGRIEVIETQSAEQSSERSGGDRARGVVPWHGLASRDAGMLRALATVKNIAETEATVLVRGESGTGKELVARAIHAESLRRDGPFVAVNCAALSPTLLESELFGHVRGAFTGATHDRVGIFEQATGGTLFLDEVGELPLELQSKLLRVLQERVVVPVGGWRPVPIDVRIVAATHRALRAEVRAGRFREDLMYRLRVVPIFLPSLRERPDDVELLLESFVEAANRRGPRFVREIHPHVRSVLRAHSWPGNVRELQNVVAHAFAVSRSPVLTLDELPPEFSPTDVAPAATRALPERDALLDAMERNGYDLTRAAAALGVSRTTLWRRRKRHGV